MRVSAARPALGVLQNTPTRHQQGTRAKEAHVEWSGTRLRNGWRSRVLGRQAAPAAGVLTMAESLDPAPDELVLRGEWPSATLLARLGRIGALERVGGAGAVLVLRLNAGSDAKAAWQAAQRALGDAIALYPVLYDRDRAPHYPTGEVTIRFESQPSDADLGHFCGQQRLRLLRRNEFVGQQVVCEPVSAASEFLPELVGRLAGLPGVKAAWANTQSSYRRGGPVAAPP
jgi:hypothetical protein